MLTWVMVLIREVLSQAVIEAPAVTVLKFPLGSKLLYKARDSDLFQVSFTLVPSF